VATPNRSLPENTVFPDLEPSGLTPAQEAEADAFEFDNIPGARSDAPIQRQSPHITNLHRFLLKGLRVDDEQAFRSLEESGLEVVPISGFPGYFNAAVRPAGSNEPWHVVDPSGGGINEFIKDVGDLGVDITAGIVTEALALPVEVGGLLTGAAIHPAGSVPGAIAGRAVGEAIGGSAVEAGRQFAGIQAGVSEEMNWKQVMLMGLVSSVLGGGARAMRGVVSKLGRFVGLTPDTFRELGATLGRFKQPPGIPGGEVLREVAESQTMLRQQAKKLGLRGASKRRFVETLPELGEALDIFQQTLRKVKKGRIPEALQADRFVAVNADVPVDMRDAMVEAAGLGRKAVEAVPKPQRAAVRTMSKQVNDDFLGSMVDNGVLVQDHYIQHLERHGRLPSTETAYEELMEAIESPEGLKAALRTIDFDTAVDEFYGEMPVAMADILRQRFQAEGMFDIAMAKPATARAAARRAQGVIRDALGETLGEEFKNLRLVASRKIDIADDIEEILGSAVTSMRALAPEEQARLMQMGQMGSGEEVRSAAATMFNLFADTSVELRNKIKAFDKMTGNDFTGTFFKYNSLQAATEFRGGKQGLRRGVSPTLRLTATGGLAGLALINQALAQSGAPSLGAPGTAALLGAAGLAAVGTPQNILRTTRAVGAIGSEMSGLPGVHGREGMRSATGVAVDAAAVTGAQMFRTPEQREQFHAEMQRLMQIERFRRGRAESDTLGPGER
jgi:hypothetical protein